MHCARRRKTSPQTFTAMCCARRRASFCPPAAGSRERAETIFAAFIIASVYADGTLDAAEYMLLLPHLRDAFGEGFGFEEVKAVIETSKKEGKAVLDFADALCDWFGVLSEELKDELVLLSLLLCAVDGKVSKKERKYIKRLIRE